MALGKGGLCRVPNGRRSAKFDVGREPLPQAAFAECLALGKGWMYRVLIFAECMALGKEGFAECSSLPSVALGKIALYRVPAIWHSAKIFALGKGAVSGSVSVTRIFNAWSTKIGAMNPWHMVVVLHDESVMLNSSALDLVWQILPESIMRILWPTIKQRWHFSFKMTNYLRYLFNIFISLFFSGKLYVCALYLLGIKSTIKFLFLKSK